MEAIVPEASASTFLKDLTDQISELAGHPNAADRRWLSLIEVVAANTAQSIRITPQTAVTRWRGESMDYGLALDVLCGQEQRGRNDSAATCCNRRI